MRFVDGDLLDAVNCFDDVFVDTFTVDEDAGSQFRGLLRGTHHGTLSCLRDGVVVGSGCSAAPR